VYKSIQIVFRHSSHSKNNISRKKMNSDLFANKSPKKKTKTTELVCEDISKCLCKHVEHVEDGV